MAEVGSAYVSILPSARGFGRRLGSELGPDLDRAGRQGGQQYSDGFQKGPSGGFSAIGKTAGLALGAGVLVGVGALAFKAGRFVADTFIDGVGLASDLNETLAKTGEIFGDSAGQVEDFASTSVRRLGQTRQQALNAASTFGVFAKSAGLSGDELVGFSTGLVDLATDLASFGNTDVDTAIQAIGSALRGESEPIRQYGVLLDDATLRQEALALGLIATTKDALTPQQRVLAAQQAILKQTGDAQGDFARTSDGMANSQRILNAAWEEAKTQLGTALLPTLTTFANVLVEKGVPALERFGAWLHDNQDEITTFGIAFGQMVLSVLEGLLRFGAGFFGLQANLATFAADSTGIWGDFGKRFLEIAIEAFGWMPGIGPQLMEARLRLGEFADGAEAKFRVAAAGAKGAQDAMNFAADAAAGLRDELESFRPEYNVIVRTNYVTTGNPNDVPFRSPNGQDFGIATGGYITGPGTGTSDSIAARLSNGEYVIRAAAVDRYGVDFFHRLNAMRFANGGLVGGGSPAPTGPVRLHPDDIRAIGSVILAGAGAVATGALHGESRALSASWRG